MLLGKSQLHEQSPPFSEDELDAYKSVAVHAEHAIIRCNSVAEIRSNGENAELSIGRMAHELETARNEIQLVVSKMDQVIRLFFALPPHSPRPQPSH